MKIEDISGTLPKKGNYDTRTTAQITDIVIHHSAADASFGAKDFAEWHIAQGWPGIGYHFVIGANGQVFQTNPLTAISYHVQGHNTYCVGICLAGDFSKHKPTDAQIKSVIQLCRKLKREMPWIAHINRHGHYKSTSCPGTMIDVEAIKSVALGKRWGVVALVALAIVIIGVVVYLLAKK